MPRPLERRGLSMDHATVKCRCGKVFCLSKEDAKRVRARMARERGNSNPVRYYQCQYGGWHWTSRLEEWR